MSMGHSAGAKVRRVGRWTRSYGLAAFLVVLALVTTIFYARQEGQIRDQNRESDQRTACQARFNDLFRQAIDQRSKYTDLDRQNLIQLVKDITTATTAKAYSDALQRYIRVSRGIDADRDKHPYPKLNDRCGPQS